MTKTTAHLKKKKEGEPELSSLPLFCDYSCRYAAFPPVSAVGACRREQAVFCSILKTYRRKNDRCAARKIRRDNTIVP